MRRGVKFAECETLLTQERLLGFSLGAALGLGVAAHHHRYYWKSTAELGRTVSRGIIPPYTPVQVSLQSMDPFFVFLNLPFFITYIFHVIHGKVSSDS